VRQLWNSRRNTRLGIRDNGRPHCERATQASAAYLSADSETLAISCSEALDPRPYPGASACFLLPDQQSSTAGALSVPKTAPPVRTAAGPPACSGTLCGKCAAAGTPEPGPGFTELPVFKLAAHPRQPGRVRAGLGDEGDGLLHLGGGLAGSAPGLSR
jgi:hypothetical protein